MNRNDFICNDELFKYTGISSYYVSENGSVANAEIEDNGNIKKFYSMCCETGRNGYIRVPLKYDKRKEKKYLVHRLVYSCFIGKLLEGLVIDHIDSNPSNNNYKNLRQVTQRDNIQHAILNETFGKGNCRSLTIEVLDSGELIDFESVRKLIEFTGLPISNGSLHKLIKHSEFKNKYNVIHMKECKNSISL